MRLSPKTLFLPSALQSWFLPVAEVLTCISAAMQAVSSVASIFGTPSATAQRLTKHPQQRESIESLQTASRACHIPLAYESGFKLQLHVHVPKDSYKHVP